MFGLSLDAYGIKSVMHSWLKILAQAVARLL